MKNKAYAKKRAATKRSAAADKADFTPAKTYPISFDGEWYLSVNPDVAASGMDPLVHFMNFGAKEGRNPNPDFNTASYLQLNPDVASFPLGPFLHYVFYGLHEGRNI